MFDFTDVKKDGVKFTPCRVIGLATELAHKVGKEKSWGSVSPELLTAVTVSPSEGGKLEVWTGQSCFHLLLKFFAFSGGVEG